MAIRRYCWCSSGPVPESGHGAARLAQSDIGITIVGAAAHRRRSATRALAAEEGDVSNEPQYDEAASFRGDPPNFTGEVWVQPLPAPDDGAAAYSVAFTPGAHTAWHTHEHGQLLTVTSGQGWVCQEGGERRTIRTGDVVWSPPGESHWHGATSHAHMVHLAVTLGDTTWGGPVIDSADEGARHT